MDTYSPGFLLKDDEVQLNPMLKYVLYVINVQLNQEYKSILISIPYKLMFKT